MARSDTAGSGPQGPALFVSDLHLAPERPDDARAFRALLAGPAREASALYILGDLFEYWIGDDDPNEFHYALLDAIGALSRAGVAVYFMHGNRDFLLGRRAAERAGMTLLHDPTHVDLFGTPTLLMHGDTLCTDDVGYQNFRAKTRRPGAIRMFLLLPLALRRRIGLALRGKSESAKASKSAAIMDVNLGTVEQTLRANGYPRLIHGHTHRPGRHIHELEGQRRERIVLADWYGHGAYLRVDADGAVVMPLPR
jgi:UDP-2,3-diacylglucosamine hydrolase